MRIGTTFKISGVLLMAFSFTMLTPIPIALYYGHGEAFPFYFAFMITLLTGFAIWLPTRGYHDPLKTQDGFIIVTLLWLLLTLFGSLPFALSHQPHASFTWAFFETMSGLSTTGATVLSRIDGLPQAVLYYRQQLQFLGGMGIIVLGVAILPLIGVGGLQLYRAESSRPVDEEKFTPRMAQTAKAMWLCYGILTLLCIVAFWACGMGLFDAVCYAFGTVSTGGYAPHTASISHYNSLTIYLVAMLFMILGSINFSCHYLALNKLSLKPYWKSFELKMFLLSLFFFGMVASLTLYYHDHYGLSESFIQGYFQVVSVGTSTGFISDSHYAEWPSFLPVLLVLIAVIGGCAGSTSGGIKMIRVLVVRQHIAREVKRLLHPQGIFPIKVGQQIISEDIVSSIYAFLGAYMILFVILWLMLLAMNLDPIVALSAVATCLANSGIALGHISNDFSALPTGALWVLSFAMLAGRLEIFTVLILFSRQFWKE
jgi:trk system potassium uptake protein